MSLRQPIETERLIFRPPILADVNYLYEFLGNSEAMKFTQVDRTLKECRQRIAVHEYYRRKDGVAPWTVIIRSTGQIIGWGGLYVDPFDRRWGVEVGYYFHPTYWGEGFASELATASLSFADSSLGLEKIRAFARPENTSSCRVLEKAGFQIEHWVPEMERNLYFRIRP
jgi:[ribosomal protein S5]-alanine N-acetyltransferase